MTRVVIAHPGVAPFIQNTVKALYEGDMLAYFETTYVDHPDYPFAKLLRKVGELLSKRFGTELSRRAFHEIPFTHLRTFPHWELLRILSSRAFKNPLISDKIWEMGELRFDQRVANGLPATIDAVYTYEHAALTTLLTAKKKGITSFYEQPSQHHTFFDQIYQEQITQYPEIVNESSRLFSNPKTAIRNQRRDQELNAADFIMCNSSFTQRTLVNAGVQAEKISVTPYGFPLVEAKSYETPNKVIFLNAGTQNLRKGLHLLYKAWRRANFNPQEAELWLIGKMTLPIELIQDLPGNVRILNNIPRSELMELYKQVSVFVLPSLADGFGMVISEAMSRGVPVITTDNTGGPDVITHGINGFLIPAGDEEALLQQMRWCVENKHHLPAIGGKAAEKAKSWQWSDFRKTVAQKIHTKISDSKNR